VYNRHYKIVFIKQVFPRFYIPGYLIYILGIIPADKNYSAFDDF